MTKKHWWNRTLLKGGYLKGPNGLCGAKNFLGERCRSVGEGKKWGRNNRVGRVPRVDLLKEVRRGTGYREKRRKIRGKNQGMEVSKTGRNDGSTSRIVRRRQRLLTKKEIGGRGRHRKRKGGGIAPKKVWVVDLREFGIVVGKELGRYRGKRFR